MWDAAWTGIRSDQLRKPTPRPAWATTLGWYQGHQARPSPWVAGSLEEEAIELPGAPILPWRGLVRTTGSEPGITG